MIHVGTMPLVNVADAPLENTSTPLAAPEPSTLPVAGSMNTVALAGAPALVLPVRVMPLVKVTVVPAPPVVLVLLPALSARIAVDPAVKLPKVTAPRAPALLFTTVSVRWTSFIEPLNDVANPLVS